ncbi:MULTISPECIES: M28 family metallopeptidase [Galbibacter]|uniref:M20/M25/M40 family metallo-hydrolase n=1 Tax=Galbibacter pacificus TaxID=2996052 RepID=A0ABT6FVT3_9FLAO|nr:M28 family peptidase [Galbibacter pacificus]MDG3583704.1 M20/M25/M40 family metallo-hydrolase [Galbibacter pacificus]MDG3587378.1 M20/M25/M40 family metallo-hydrolase [Galbibacter pacificus]
MKKQLFILAVSIMALGCKSSTVPVSEQISQADKTKEVVLDAQSKEVSVSNASEVEQIITFLASDRLNGREAGSEGINEAANYIENIFKTNGIKPYFKTYRDTLTNFDAPAFNIVGLVEGNDARLKNEYIVIGAHYDHIGSGKPVNGDTIANGANDNASGTTAVLEIAKYFGTHKTNKRSLLFVLFSAEEKGLLGSKHLASKLKKENFNLYTMVNFEMIGVPMQREELMYITGYKETNMAEKINTYAGKDIVGFLPKAGEYQLFKRSDNYPFYTEFNVPSQTVCTFDFENYEYYHHVDDEVGEMDFEHMATVINEMTPVLEKMANVPTDEIKMN